MELEGKIINFLGDSITQGAGVDDPQNIYVARIGRMCGLKAANNYGISGTRIARQQKRTEDNPRFDLDFCQRALEMDKNADINVVLGGTNDFGHGDAPLGKPCDRGQAAQMLRRLSGRRHTVVSGVTLRTAGRMHTFSAESGVWFRPLSEEEIGYYLDTFAPYDKAGSYGIQEWIGYAAIEKINGSFYNVMGLPIQKVYVELEKFLQ